MKSDQNRVPKDESSRNSCENTHKVYEIKNSAETTVLWLSTELGGGGEGRFSS